MIPEEYEIELKKRLEDLTSLYGWYRDNDGDTGCGMCLGYCEEKGYEIVNMFELEGFYVKEFSEWRHHIEEVNPVYGSIDIDKYHGGLAAGILLSAYPECTGDWKSDRGLFKSNSDESVSLAVRCGDNQIKCSLEFPHKVDVGSFVDLINTANVSSGCEINCEIGNIY